MLHIVGQLIFGLIIGVIARILLPGQETHLAAGMLGWVETALIGFAGSLIGSFIGRMIWKDQNYSAGWILSILGAIALLVLIRFI